ncbi:hypothetical protein BT69DRAFT_1265221, partial [Atractiella rhizophila]
LLLKLTTLFFELLFIIHCACEEDAGLERSGRKLLLLLRPRRHVVAPNQTTTTKRLTSPTLVHRTFSYGPTSPSCLERYRKERFRPPWKGLLHLVNLSRGQDYRS